MNVSLKSEAVASITQKLMDSLGNPSRPVPVIVVEDDRNDAEIMRLTLEDIGCSVCIASDEQTAIKIIDSNPNKFRIAFVDLKLPKGDGQNVMKHLAIASPETHVIIATGTNRLPEIPPSAYYGVVQKPLLKEVAKEIISKTQTS